MASIKIQSSSSGGGSITLTAPTTSSNRTVTLPDEDVTLGGGGGGVTHLGTVVPQSGAISATLSSLTLTDYKMLQINIEGISLGNYQWIGLVSSAQKNAIGYIFTGSSTKGAMTATIDLATSAVYTQIMGSTTTSDGSYVANGTTYTGGHDGQEFNITNSSTSVGVYTRGAGYGFTATGGSIRFYGVK
jgi:hypothetical protein